MEQEKLLSLPQKPKLGLSAMSFFSYRSQPPYKVQIQLQGDNKVQIPQNPHQGEESSKKVQIQMIDQSEQDINSDSQSGSSFDSNNLNEESNQNLNQKDNQNINNPNRRSTIKKNGKFITIKQRQRIYKQIIDRIKNGNKDNQEDKQEMKKQIIKQVAYKYKLSISSLYQWVYQYDTISQIEERYSQQQLIQIGNEENTLYQIIKKVFKQKFKRTQAKKIHRLSTAISNRFKDQLRKLDIKADSTLKKYLLEDNGENYSQFNKKNKKSNQNLYPPNDTKVSYHDKSRKNKKQQIYSQENDMEKLLSKQKIKQNRRDKKRLSDHNKSDRKIPNNQGPELARIKRKYTKRKSKNQRGSLSNYQRILRKPIEKQKIRINKLPTADNLNLVQFNQQNHISSNENKQVLSNKVKQNQFGHQNTSNLNNQNPQIVNENIEPIKQELLFDVDKYYHKITQRMNKNLADIRLKIDKIFKQARPGLFSGLFSGSYIAKAYAQYGKHSILCECSVNQKQILNSNQQMLNEQNQNNFSQKADDQQSQPNYEDIKNNVAKELDKKLSSICSQIYVLFDKTAGQLQLPESSDLKKIYIKFGKPLLKTV